VRMAIPRMTRVRKLCLIIQPAFPWVHKAVIWTRETHKRKRQDQDTIVVDGQEHAEAG
jgi:hypothetical protein